jgi:leucyl/phenylalanyl-tRNA--protein transferase
MHKLGIAKSVEVWKGDELVGGLYGLEIGNIFCGESMFSKVSNASKVAFISLVTSPPLSNQNTPINNKGASKYKLIDCQMYNDHLASLGAKEIDRAEFLKFLPK